MPWSSSWFQMASILGAAWSRSAVTFCPDSTVNCGRHLVAHLEAGRGQRVGEALRPVLGQRQVGDALDLGDHRVAHALGLELRGDVRAGREAHAVVVALDQGAGPARGVELAVEVDHGDARRLRLDRDLGERLAVERQDDQRVDLLVDEGLHLADLLVDVVAPLDRLERHVAVLLRLGLGVRRDGGDPAVVGRGRREADGDRLAGGVVAGRRRSRRSRSRRTRSSRRRRCCWCRRSAPHRRRGRRPRGAGRGGRGGGRRAKGTSLTSFGWACRWSGRSGSRVQGVRGGR